MPDSLSGKTEESRRFPVNEFIAQWRQREVDVGGGAEWFLKNDEADWTGWVSAAGADKVGVALP